MMTNVAPSIGEGTGKVCARKPPGAARKRLSWWARPDDLMDLGYARVSLQEALGQPVSDSLIYRRALDLLADHLDTLDCPEAIHAERVRLVNHLR